jgi:hypothetical protein
MRYAIGATVAVLALAGSACSARGQVYTGGGVDHGGLTHIQMAIGDVYGMPVDYVPSYIYPDELPVVYLLAREAGVSPEVVMALREQGWSWMDITYHLGVDPYLYVAHLPRQRGYWGYPGRNYAYLTDRHIIDYVNLALWASYHRRPVTQIIVIRQRVPTWTYYVHYHAPRVVYVHNRPRRNDPGRRGDLGRRDDRRDEPRRAEPRHPEVRDPAARRDIAGVSSPATRIDRTGPPRPSAERARPSAQQNRPAVPAGRPSTLPDRRTIQQSRPTAERARPVQPERPSAQPTRPTAQPTRPAAQPTRPVAQPTRPTAQPTRPTAQPTRPAAQPTRPAAQPTRPAAQPTRPAATTTARSAQARPSRNDSNRGD